MFGGEQMRECLEGKNEAVLGEQRGQYFLGKKRGAVIGGEQLGEC